MAATKLDLIESRRSELHAAFLAFGSVSEQLARAFDGLRDEVEQLRAELGEAHAGKEHLAARPRLPDQWAAGRGCWSWPRMATSLSAIRRRASWWGEPLIGEPFAAVLERASAAPRGVGEAHGAPHRQVRQHLAARAGERGARSRCSPT